MKLYLSILLFFYIWLLNAQSTALNVHLFEDDMSVNRDMKFEVFWSEKTIKLLVKDSLLFIPDSLQGKTVNLVLLTQNYQLHFDKLSLAWNPNYLHWVIYVDFRPIHEKWKWQLKSKFKKIKWLFAIQRGNGTDILFYGFKLPKNGILKIN
jgi:hypothetical protein